MRRTTFQTNVLLFTVSVACLWSVNPHSLRSAEKDAKPLLVQKSANRRVTVLGATRGVAFLSNPGAVNGGSRSPGPHRVDWMQIAIYVETPADVETLGRWQWDILTPEGKEFAQPLANAGQDAATTGHASSTIEYDLNDSRLPTLVYPVKVPQPDSESRGQIVIMRVSGDLNSGKTAHLKLKFSGKENDQAEEFLFRVPMP